MRDDTVKIDVVIICPNCGSENAQKKLSISGFSASCPDCKTRRRNLTETEFFEDWKEKTPN